jgi:hypothetical protein
MDFVTRQRNARFHHDVLMQWEMTRISGQSRLRRKREFSLTYVLEESDIYQRLFWGASHLPCRLRFR